MDRMLYLAMTGAKQTMVSQAVNTNNLANVSTTGFKADLEQFRSMPVYGPGMPSRVYAMTESPATDLSSGTFRTTGRDLDVAIQGNGWIAVQAADGSEAFTRAGDLHVDGSGLLTTGTGLPVIGTNGGPILVPQNEKFEIGIDGTISVRPVGQAASTLAEVDRIKLVNPQPESMRKNENGLMELEDGQSAAPDATIRIMSGVLETSNVNAVESMVNMIELSRQYEMQVKMMKTAEENDASVTQMMRLA
jgi:flagellar basal-body rod protein FlgF